MTNSTTIPNDHAVAILESSAIAVRYWAKTLIKRADINIVFETEELEDIAGDCYLKACSSYASYDPAKGKISTWANTIARHLVKDAIDDKIKESKIFLSLPDKGEDESEETDFEDFVDICGSYTPEVLDLSSEYAADREAIEHDFSARFTAACESLSEKDRAVALLLEQGYKTGEIAREIGSTANAAGKRVYSVRAALRVALAPSAAEYGITEHRRPRAMAA